MEVAWRLESLLMVTTVPLGARRGRRLVVRRCGPRWLVAITLSKPSKVSSRPRTPEPRPVAALLMITSTWQQKNCYSILGMSLLPARRCFWSSQQTWQHASCWRGRVRWGRPACCQWLSWSPPLLPDPSGRPCIPSPAAHPCWQRPGLCGSQSLSLFRDCYEI